MTKLSVIILLASNHLKLSIMNLLLNTLFLLTSFKSFSQALTICDLKGNLLVQKEQLISAFNTISKKKAIKIGYSYEPETSIHSLVFYFSKSAGLAFKLEKNNENYTLQFSGSTVKHACIGEPCESCQMVSSWLETIQCSFSETSCDSCKCNHILSETIGKML
jgi:hypothetical protein